MTRLWQAENAIKEVEICLAQGLLDIAANRIYYGMFYAMLALGLLRDFETSKHIQLMGWFNKNFVHTGIFPKLFSQIVKKAFETRTNSDYSINQVLKPADLEQQLGDMKLFINTIKTWIAANLT